MHTLTNGAETITFIARSGHTEVVTVDASGLEFKVLATTAARAKWSKLVSAGFRRVATPRLTSVGWRGAGNGSDVYVTSTAPDGRLVFRSLSKAAVRKQIEAARA
jgi:hypothetical protein